MFVPRVSAAEVAVSSIDYASVSDLTGYAAGYSLLGETVPEYAAQNFAAFGSHMAHFCKIMALLVGYLALVSTAVASAPIASQPLVISHRGASGYLPENTLVAAALAHGLGADYIELDVVLSKDGVPIVLHDIHLDSTTDVRLKFPDRRRTDGRWYAIDLTLAEIKRLSVQERRDAKSAALVFPGRFPESWAPFTVPTLEEMIQLVQGLNRSRGRKVGLYPELKAPAFHQLAGLDIAKTVVTLLARYGYATRDARIYLQCFDPKTLRYLRKDLKTSLRLVQLIAENSWGEAKTDFSAMRTEAGIRDIATYADGIGPWIPHVLQQTKGQVQPQATSLVRWAHAAGLFVHPFTVRRDALPAFVKSLDVLHAALFNTAKVDGVFTDFPDETMRFLQRVSGP